MNTASAPDTVERTLEIIRKRTPAYGELTDRFGSLFTASAKVCDEVATKGVAVPEVDPARVSSGVPVLVGFDFGLWREAFALSAERLIPVLCEALELEDTAAKELAAVFSDADTILGLVRARIEGDLQHFENTSLHFDATPSAVLLFALETVCSPVLRAAVQSMGESLSSLSWDEGHCPACGSTPSISQLSPKEFTDLDQLVGGGGKKFLHCSLCGHDWRFKRNACPSCGNDDSETREIFYVDDVRFEHIEACHKCGRYCLNIDMREFEPRPDLDALQMGLIHLDVHAQENRLSPLTATLWNTVE
ncbi:formate dehydrogenase accessory protein FdhE [Salidesulfovibrio brasiliensis]|uniref:formate dehydrogenase accessory protein FdhE n=1 Tax=Salidesulfovibrio brasiliensis TaxID=221711 RepID=UPI0006CFCB46|nr:formate dehydrogenase accessory protein FdhE [Salidesulfovibrio brasiliensis]